MKTLKEHNEAAQQTFYVSNAVTRNGIECPNCNEELFDSNPSVCLASMPPQRNIHCGKCDYHGYRY